jgi:hypothetical protein
MLLAPLFFDEVAQLALHGLERVMDHFIERFVRAVVVLFFVGNQFVPRPDGDVDPAPIRIAFVMGVVCLLDGDVAAIDVIAKFVEPRGVSHDQVVDLVRFFHTAVSDVNGQLHN